MNKQNSIKTVTTKGASFQNLGQSFNSATLAFPKSFFAKNLKGFLISFFICIFLVYGFNAIIFLSSNIFNAKPEYADFNRRLFISNLASSFTTLLMVFAYTKFYDKISNKKLGLLGLILGIYFSYLGTQMVVWANFNSQVEGGKELSLTSSLLFSVVPSIVGYIYFYFWQKSNQIHTVISDQEFKLLSLEKLKTQAELNALQARINPHFLHNALNSIASLVHTDPDKAETMTMLLSKLFRYTTGTKNQYYTSISNELELVKTYLDIEQVRFGDRLHYSVSVEKGLEETQIPSFLLQPVVENAIKYGIAKIAEKGIIDVKITKYEQHIVLMVHDNGPDFADDFFTGYGMQSIQDKLKLLYADEATFAIQPKGYKAIIIKLPC